MNKKEKFLFDVFLIRKGEGIKFYRLAGANTIILDESVLVLNNNSIFLA